MVAAGTGGGQNLALVHRMEAALQLPLCSNPAESVGSAGGRDPAHGRENFALAHRMDTTLPPPLCSNPADSVS